MMHVGNFAGLPVGHVAEIAIDGIGDPIVMPGFAPNPLHDQGPSGTIPITVEHDSSRTVGSWNKLSVDSGGPSNYSEPAHSNVVYQPWFAEVLYFWVFTPTKADGSVNWDEPNLNKYTEPHLPLSQRLLWASDGPVNTFVPQHRATTRVWWRCMSIDPDGKVATAKGFWDVNSVDTVWSSAITAVVASDGVYDDFPDHNPLWEFTELEDALALARGLTTSGCRIIVADRGAEYTIEQRMNIRNAGGPILVEGLNNAQWRMDGRPTVANNGNAVAIIAFHDDFESDLIWRDCICDGRYRQADPGDLGHVWIFANPATYGVGTMSFVNCDVRGMHSHWVVSALDLPNLRTRWNTIDCRGRDWSDYLLYHGGEAYLSKGLCGMADKKADAGGQRFETPGFVVVMSGNSHGCGRLVSGGVYMWGYSLAGIPGGWTRNAGGEPAAQACLRHAHAGGHTCYFGPGLMYGHHLINDGLQEAGPQNIVVEGMTVIAHAHAYRPLGIGASGFLIRNARYYWPDAGGAPGYTGRRAMVDGDTTLQAADNNDARRVQNTAFIDMRRRVNHQDGLSAVYVRDDISNYDAAALGVFESCIDYVGGDLGNPPTTHQLEVFGDALADWFAGGVYWGFTHLDMGITSIADGETVFVGYPGSLNDGRGLSNAEYEALFQGGTDHRIYDDNGLGYHGNFLNMRGGELSVAYVSGGVSITNNSGSAFVAASGNLRLELDWRHDPNKGPITGTTRPATLPQVRVAAADPSALIAGLFRDAHGKFRRGRRVGPFNP
jgi:hypothetical protein